MSDSSFSTWVAGRSVEGREIVVRSSFDPLEQPAPPGLTLLIGGQHGNEPATVHLLEEFQPPTGPVAILACANPDGLIAHSRYNACGVDINRNCEFNWSQQSEEPSGPHPWSEPETVALRDCILALRPAKIVSLHWALAEIDADGVQSTSLAEAMWAALPPAQQTVYRLRVTEIGRGQRRLQHTYAECPGSLGQWCGYGLRYPDGSAPAMVTLELPHDPDLDRPAVLPDDHLETVHAAWAEDSEGYLRAVTPGVYAMLDAACRHA
ncbi:MAG TPA: M14 family zinc carboxypeptidase [Chthoniobacterales bacterium]